MGVVFVLLIGEIDLSIASSAAIAAVVVAELQLPDRARRCPGCVAILLAIAASRRDRRVPGLVRRLHRRAVVHRHARRLLVWQGVVLSIGTRA